MSNKVTLSARNFRMDGNDNKPKTIGYYTLGDTIGEGTFGRVVLGTHLITGEKVHIIAGSYQNS